MHMSILCRRNDRMHNLGSKIRGFCDKSMRSSFWIFKNPVKSSTVYFTSFYPCLPPFHLTPTKIH